MKGKKKDKLSVKVRERVEAIKDFLNNSGLGDIGIIIDSNCTRIYQVMSVWSCGLRIWVSGKNVHGEMIRDQLEISEFNRVFWEMKRQDEDFANHVEFVGVK